MALTAAVTTTAMTTITATATTIKIAIIALFPTPTTTPAFTLSTSPLAPAISSHRLKDGFFAGWSFVTIMLSFLGAGGGILVALVMKHADSILKTLAVAGAIVVSTVLGTYRSGLGL